jgi:enamine deaminase RidA (YjgF/YER057c/UK114 family)
MGGIVRISTNAPWEPIAGYSRAVKAGNWVSISGTTATDERGALVGIGQMYIQAQRAIANLASVLDRLGLGLRDVVRTRMFVTDISRFNEAARAHRDAFGDTRPATTMVEVRRLVHPDMLIEIEAEAYAGERSGGGGEMPSPYRAAAAKPQAKRAETPTPARVQARKSTTRPQAKKSASRKPKRRR